VELMRTGISWADTEPAEGRHDWILRELVERLGG